MPPATSESIYTHDVALILVKGQVLLKDFLLHKTVGGLRQAVNKELKARKITNKKLKLSSFGNNVSAKLVPKLDWVTAAGGQDADT